MLVVQSMGRVPCWLFRVWDGCHAGCYSDFMEAEFENASCKSRPICRTLEREV